MRLGLIAHDEAVKGNAIKIRAALLDTHQWEQPSFPIENTYPGADFVFFTSHEPYKVVGTQRKAITDFIQSWRDGRLQDQLYKLMTHVNIAVLIIEGPAWINHKTGGLVTQYGDWTEKGKPVPYSSYVESIADLTGNSPGRFFLIMSADVYYTIAWLKEIGPRKFDNEEYNGWERQTLPVRTKNLGVDMLLSWDQVALERAKSILRVYKTPFRAIDALRNGGWRVPGIGRGIQERILAQGNTEYDD